MTRIFQLTASQWLPRTPEEVFAYFADAFNLERITALAAVPRSDPAAN